MEITSTTETSQVQVFLNGKLFEPTFLDILIWGQTGKLLSPNNKE